MAADLGDFTGEEIDAQLRTKRRSLVSNMGHDTASPLTASPITAPTRSTPPHTALALERPILENFVTPSPSNTNSPAVTTSRNFGGLDNEFAMFAQSPLARAATHDLHRNPMSNPSMEEVSDLLSTFKLTRDLPSSAPVTPPIQGYHDPRSRASTLTESSPPLQALQKDLRHIPHHYLTPPSEGQASPANLALSQSLPVSRRNSNTEVMRVGQQDLSVIYENGSETAVYHSDHRKSSGALSGSTWSNTPPEASKYDENMIGNDNASSKNVFHLLKTEDGHQFPYLSTPSDQAMPLPRATRHSSTPSWPTAPNLPTRNHASRSSYPEAIEHRAPRDADYRTSTSGNPSPHASSLRTPPNGRSATRFDHNSSEFVPGAWNADPASTVHFQRPVGAYYADATPANTFYPGTGYVPPIDTHGAYYGGGPRPADPNEYMYTPRELNNIDYRPPYSRDNSTYSSRGRGGSHRPRGSDYGGFSLEKTRIQDFASKIPDLCRDQNGCRHLQGQLDTRDEETIQVIFDGAKPYFPELMSDPFGNYLCQKLLETCNDVQRTELVQIVAKTMVQISLNQHGTRAVQKLLDHLTLPEQIALVTDALRPDVVLLTKDLNGNHVIQKCLNKLESSNNQFIYDAVTKNCVEVASHKHGCCVFQRCIDHASKEQTNQLYSELVKNTDQFGNYVLQYILDRPKLSLPLEPLIRQFQGHVVQLAKHKFSSNVIEKCVRVAEQADRESMIAELTRPGVMAALIEDQFGNYVVQTSLDHAEPEQRAQLIKEIMPYLNNIKSKTWYKRMMNKIGLGVNNGQFDSGRHSMGQRQFVDDNVHPRRATEPRGLSPMQGYGNAHTSSRSVDQFPPGFMHAHPVGSDRNGYRGHQHAPSHSQAAPQYGNNFYPAYNPRTPVHHSEYRGNGEY